MPIKHPATGRLAATTLALALGLTTAQAETDKAPTAATTVAQAAPATSAASSGTTGSNNSGAASLSRSDRRFAEDAATDGLAEVMLGQLAQQRAANADVRQFGERMVADHGKANTALMALASAGGMPLPDKPTSAQQRMHDKLAKLSGAEFDKSYMAHMVGDHRKGVALFEKQARSGDDAGLKSFAQQTLPTLQDHMKLANTLHDGLKQKR